jgi:hypothetical protein
MMPSETQSPREIEREIEIERAELKDTIADLQDNFSIERVVRQATHLMRDNGGEIGRSISRSVKQNPLALAVTGVGLAWLIFGSEPRPSDDRPRRRGFSDRDWDDDSDDEPMFRRRPANRASAHYGGAQSPSRAADHFPPRRDIPEWAMPERHRDERYATSHHERDTRSSMPVAAYNDKLNAESGPSSNAAAGVMSKAQSAVASAKDTAQRAKDTMRDGAADVKAKADETLTFAEAGISVRADAARDRAGDLQRRLSKGTEELSEAARHRVLAAREKALAAQQSLSRAQRRGADAAADFYDEYPLAVGAVAMAVGAAIAGAMPRTQMEDEMMGEQSDALIEEAERIFAEEKAKAQEVASAAVEEVRAIGAETKANLDSNAPGTKSAEEAVLDEAKSATDRVIRATAAKAEETKLGEPGKS